jgi:hypothetical protein
MPTILTYALSASVIILSLCLGVAAIVRATKKVSSIPTPVEPPAIAVARTLNDDLGKLRTQRFGVRMRPVEFLESQLEERERKERRDTRRDVR